MTARATVTIAAISALAGAALQAVGSAETTHAAHPLNQAQTTMVLSPSKDNTLFSESGSESSGVGVSLFVGRTNGGNVRRGLVHFDIAGTIPAGSTIDSVVLTLNMSRTNTGGQTIELHKLTADWGEGNSNSTVGGGRGASAQSGDATWTLGSFG